MKFECVYSGGARFKWGVEYEGLEVNEDNYILTDEQGNEFDIVRRHRHQEIFLECNGCKEYIFHQVVDGVKFEDVQQAIIQLNNKEAKFMKYECISDNTKKFTVGKLYDAPTEHAKHTVALKDDAGRNRIAIVTHGGEGLRWNSGGTKFAAFGKKDESGKSRSDKAQVNGRKTELTDKDKANLSVIFRSVAKLVAATLVLFVSVATLVTALVALILMLFVI